MGLISRLRRITAARLDAFLEAAEEPEVVLPQLLKELAERAAEAEKAEAKALAAVAGAQRRVDEANGRANRLRQGAELALLRGKVGIAREAIGEQVSVEAEAERRHEELVKAEGALRDARSVRLQLVEQHGRLKARSEALIARVRADQSRKRIRRAERVATGGILDQVARMDADLCTEDAESALAHDIASATCESLDERLRSLEREALIEQRLAAIRRRTAAGKRIEAET